MSTQRIQFGYDKDAVWNRVSGRLSVFLDTNCWINMADGKKEAPVRIREKLRKLVVAGRVFCPLSWGILNELFCQSGPSLLRTASLMEELSLNAIFIIREELYAWEFSRSVRRFVNGSSDDSLNGLFVPPAAYVGSGPPVSLDLPDGASLSPEAQAHAQAYMKRELSKIGIVELAKKRGGRKTDRTPPAYSDVAKKAKEMINGNKNEIFLAEANHSFDMYIIPLMGDYPRQTMEEWSAQFGPADDDEAWFLKALAELPALHNYTDVMVVASSQPDRKDKYNHFMDNEIMVAPLAYCNVFGSEDKGVKDIAGRRTKILTRTNCEYCDSLAALEIWLTENAA
jgi:hypothetical protein